MAGTKTVYWDSCIFLAYLHKEDHHKEYAVIKRTADQFDLGVVDIVTSSIALVEILESRLSLELRSKFRELLKRPNLVQVDASSGVMLKASEIRNFFHSNPIDVGQQKTLSTPDAIHVASAIAAQKLSGSNVPLWTIDRKNKPNEDGLSLLYAASKLSSEFKIDVQRPS